MIKPATARYYRFQLHRHLLPTFGALRLRDLDREMLQAFVVGKRQQGFSSSTLHGLRTTLSKVLGQAVTWRYMDENPARGLSIGERVPKKEPAFLDPRDASRLIEALPEPCRTIVIVATLTGLRIGEIAALRWGRVDFFRGVVQVKQTYSEDVGFGTPKTLSSVHDVPMSEPVRKALLAHRPGRTEPDAAALVFTSKAGTPIGPKNLANRVLRPTCVKLGLRPISWHVLRHTHATWLSESGAGGSGHPRAIRRGNDASHLHPLGAGVETARCSQCRGLIVPFCSPVAGTTREAAGDNQLKTKSKTKRVGEPPRT